MTAPEPCGVMSRESSDEIAGTATEVGEYLLIEHRSVWQSDAVADLRGRSDEMAGLVDAAVGAGMRVLAIRRQERIDGPLLVFRASARDDPRLTGGLLAETIADLTADPLGHLPDQHDVLFLICTHGRRDPCCTRWGKPAAFDLADDPAVWETSHVGGHRYAGNLVALPFGLYFGRVDRDNASQVIADVRSGSMHLELLRGRSAWPRPAQAAEVFVRRLLGDDAIAGWRLKACDEIGAQQWRVGLETPGGRATSIVERVELEGLAYEGCFKDAPAARFEYREVAVQAG
jgi:hypothetical protein